MKHLLFVALAVALGAVSCTPARYAKGDVTGNSRTAQLNYIDRYKDAAVAESQRGGVPASIILAQALLESASGLSELAQQANNHFGMKCGSQWNGPSYSKRDDEIGKSCFRQYRSVAESYADHSRMFRDPSKGGRYEKLFELDRTDYKGWARGLQSAGYATNPSYANLLIDLIDRFQLYRYDRPGTVVADNPVPVLPPRDEPQPVPPPVREPQTPSQPQAGPPEMAARQRVFRVNDARLITSRPGESLLTIGRLYQLNPDFLAAYNENQYPVTAQLPENTRVYLQRKRETWKGQSTYHGVKEGQTMFQIAQEYGIMLDRLLLRNGLKPGEEPATGQQVRLKGSRRSNEFVRLRDRNARPPAAEKPAPTVPLPTTPPVTERPTETPRPSSPAPSTEKPTRPATTGVPYPTETGTPPAPGKPAPVVVKPVTEPAGSGYHVVAKGDTLYSLARRYGLTVARLRQLNGLTADAINIGQRLRVR
jgi:LysM repeat protein